MPNHKGIVKWIFILLVGVLVLGQFAVLTRNAVGRIYLFDLLLILFSFSGVIWLVIEKKKLYFPKQLIMFFVFSLFASFSLLRVLPNFSVEDGFSSAFYLIRYVAYILSAVVIYNFCRYSEIDSDYIQSVFIFSGVFIAVAGFVQLIILPDFTVLDPTLGWDPHKNRLASTFFDPNFTGSYLFLCLALLLNKYSSFEKKPLLLLQFVLVLTALFLTFSRSSWGAFAVLITFYGLIKYPKLLFASALAIFLTYFAVPRFQTRLSGLADPTDSAYFRLISWQNGLKLASENLIFGVGFNTLRPTQLDYGIISPFEPFSNSAAGIDSSFLFVLTTTGLIGLLVYVAAFFYPAVSQFRSKNIDQKVFILSMTFGLLLQSQFINALFYPQIMFLWFVSVSSILHIES